MKMLSLFSNAYFKIMSIENMLFDIFCKLIWQTIENMKNNSYGNYGNRGRLETNPVAVQFLVIIKDVLTTP